MERKHLIKLASEAGFGKLLTGDGLPTMWHGCDLEILERFARLVAAAEREVCAKLLKDAATRLTHEGKRTNQYDRHTADVLIAKADEILMRSNVLADRREPQRGAASSEQSERGRAEGSATD